MEKNLWDYLLKVNQVFRSFLEKKITGEDALNWLTTLEYHNLKFSRDMGLRFSKMVPPDYWEDK